MPRKLPALTDDTRPFWTGGEAGELRIHHCTACERYFHPPAPICPRCTSFDVAAQAVSGRGVIVASTVNHQAWNPELEASYSVAIVELEEQAGLRFLSNIVNCPPEAVHTGMPVQVVFERNDDVWIPLFERRV
ncbi:MAG: OB-fold domain-containing protein [Caulobacter sp.]|nr:OB-fold domain-containing protein [Caulobacter sp.]